MTTVGVTGAEGFLGWHVRARLHALEAYSVRSATRETFSTTALLDEFVAGCDYILHLAGVNRGEPDDVAAGNVDLAQALIDSKSRTGSHFGLAYANSTKAGSDSPYGLSKLKAAEMLAEAQSSAGDRFSDYIFPHLFGEHGRPFYNSGVTTFAHQIATGGTPEIIVDSEVELLHA
ncbi:MAG: NAD-dependent epimerase/dehydratase family protein, partial [Acidimicrobiia bacterium]|nr:NAD-dependent epimerase/dehydratase family protein [Acidimicrobiia bacterium]